MVFIKGESKFFSGEMFQKVISQFNMTNKYNGITSDYSSMIENSLKILKNMDLTEPSIEDKKVISIL